MCIKYEEYKIRIIIHVVMYKMIIALSRAVYKYI